MSFGCYGCNFCNRCGKVDRMRARNAKRSCPRCGAELDGLLPSCPQCGMRIPPSAGPAGTPSQPRR